jgi:hypothetical protein
MPVSSHRQPLHLPRRLPQRSLSSRLRSARLCHAQEGLQRVQARVNVSDLGSSVLEHSGARGGCRDSRGGLAGSRCAVVCGKDGPRWGGKYALS